MQEGRQDWNCGWELGRETTSRRLTSKCGWPLSDCQSFLCLCESGEAKQNTPVNTPWPWSLAADSSAFLSTGKPRTVTEQKPEPRATLQASPTAATTRRDMHCQ